VKPAAILLALILPLTAQTPAPRSFVGTVAGFRPESAEVEVRPDVGDMVVARLTADTLAQKIAPGEKDLKKAEAIEVTALAKGDRVLVTLEPDSAIVRRIVVMSAADIAHRNDADRLDWQKRGVAGIVAARNGNRITLRNKTLTGGEVETVVMVTDRTAIKRYAPDSVKFADAKPAKLAEISVGDQVRARGEKAADGLTVSAEDLVFGTFVIEAGAVAAIDSAAGEFQIKQLGTGKLVTVKLTADSQLKQMFSIPPVGGGAGRAGVLPGNAPPGGLGGAPPGGSGNAPPGGFGGVARGGFGGARPGAGFDINQMIEHMPAVKLDDLKPGGTVVITSTKGAKSDRITAILVLANADMLIQMASMMKATNGGIQAAQGMNGLGMGGDLNGLMGLGLGGMNQ
jgi:hypothetical protein